MELIPCPSLSHLHALTQKMQSLFSYLILGVFLFFLPNYFSKFLSDKCLKYIFLLLYLFLLSPFLFNFVVFFIGPLCTFPPNYVVYPYLEI